MQPRRPDSAKSRVTQKTLDTELNQSKFSQTFTSYTTFQGQKKDDFLKYLQQKDKDPKFKKYQQINLPQIPQKQPKQQLSKINSKPFEKRNTKVVSKAKIQQTKQASKQTASNFKPSIESINGKWTLNQQNVTKKDSKQQMSASTSFAQKNKQKMNSITAGLKKIQNGQRKVQKNIELKGFKVKVPGKKEIKNNQEQKQAQNQFMVGPTQKVKPAEQKKQLSKQQKQTRIKPQKSDQELKRQEQLLQISRFINQVEMKNIDYYPEGYEQFVEKNQSQMPQNIDKININDFLMQPTQRDYEKMRRKITNNQKRLLDQDNLAESRMSFISQGSRMSMNPSSVEQSSIDLDRIIDGDSESEMNRQAADRNEIFLSSISSKDLKERNLFLTQVLKGRVTQQQITKLQEMDRSQLKMRKLEEQPKEEDDDLQIMEINMMKRKSNRLLERNFVEASGQIYRDCDYLSEENKQRLERLINGEMDPSPFQISEWERFAIRRIDEGIRLYRQFSSPSNNSINQQMIAQQCLPKDPILRKEAERKILKDKINSVNSRLHQIQNIVISQARIQQLIEMHRTSKPSEYTQALIKERNDQMQQLSQKSKLAAQMLQKAEGEKGDIERTLRQMQEEYKKYEKECKQFQKLTIEEIVRREKQEIKGQKQRIQEIALSLQEIERGTDESISQFHKEIEGQIQILKEIQNLGLNPPLIFNDLRGGQTVEDLDAMFEKRAKQDPQLAQLRDRALKDDGKQNQSGL